METKVEAATAVKFPFESVLLSLGAFAGGPLAALVLLLMARIQEFTTSNSFPEWLTMTVLLPLVGIALLAVIASFALMLFLPLNMFRFMDGLANWISFRKANRSKAPLTNAVA